MKITSIILFLSFSIILRGYGQQDYTTKDKKAIEFFNKGLDLYNQNNDEESRVYLKKALARDDQFIEPHLLLAQIESEVGNFNEELAHFDKVILINPEYDARVYYLAVKSCYINGVYSQAVPYIEKYDDLNFNKKHVEGYMTYLRPRIEFAMNAIEHPVDFSPVSAGDSVNTDYPDYWPSLSVDEKLLVFTVQVPKKTYNQMEPPWQEDMYASFRREDGSWEPSFNIGPPMNTGNNEGAQAIRADGRILYYTVCNREGDYGSCDIYYSEFLGDAWSTPLNIGPPISTSAWESNPAPSADGKYLFFASGGRDDSYGKRDIYYSVKGEDGDWTAPRNLGDSINTAGNEYCPFLHPDGKTLYFASDFWTGMGGQDIFYSKKINDTTWTKPVNIGYPINTHKDDFGLIVNARGNLAMFSSSRPGSRDWDIFQFDLYEAARPTPVTYLTGKVFDAITGKPLGGEVELINIHSNENVSYLQADIQTGHYLTCLPVGNDYALNVARKGYLFYSENFSLQEVHEVSKPYVLNVPLQPIREGAIIVLRNIFFGTDSANLRPESVTELQKLLQLLETNPGLCIEIGGHTDNVGSNDYNLKLSDMRARAVFDYLIKNGIKASRLSYKGYSFSVPLADNNTEEGRALNRRTEVKVTAVK